jgi:hypothetical protein
MKKALFHLLVQIVSCGGMIGTTKEGIRPELRITFALHYLNDLGQGRKYII